MACRECVPHNSPDYDYWWDEEGCIDGTVYGWCSSPDCYGLCDPEGRCPCECHAKPGT